MALDADARQFLDEFAAAGTPMPWEVGTPAEAREVLKGLQVPPERPIEVGRVEDRVAETATGPIPIRIYTPEGTGPFPVLLWFHGGGWTVGSIEESDTTCRSLCLRAGAIVVCPEYRLAPEHPFPAAAEDCLAVTAWVAREAGLLSADASRLAVGGDSSGGNLAAVVALMARDLGGPRLVFQLLVYPVVGLPSDGRDSYETYAHGHFLTRTGMDWFAEQYISQPQDAENSHLSPLRADDLSGLPPALVIAAECDPLYDEGVEYARRLSEAGVDCVHRCYEGQIHAFFVLTDQISAAFTAHDEAAAALKRAFASTV
jgi:acetyl esterase